MPDATPEAPEFSYPPELTVYPSDNDPEPVIYGPNGEVLRWRQRPIGFAPSNAVMRLNGSGSETR